MLTTVFATYRETAQEPREDGTRNGEEQGCCERQEEVESWLWLWLWLSAMGSGEVMWETPIYPARVVTYHGVQSE